MGCDIHCYAEVRVGGVWTKVGDVFDNEYFDADNPISEYNQPKTDEPFQACSYNTFAILANVRNGEGFAGCDTGDGFMPIAMPKGVPSDASDWYKRKVKEWGCDGHSHSWLTLAEIKAYNWDQRTKERGWVDVEQYKEFKANGQPSSWCGGVSGGRIRHVTNEQMDTLITADVADDQTYTQVEWGVSYRDAARCFLECLPALEALGKPEDVRIVFFFDN